MRRIPAWLVVVKFRFCPLGERPKARDNEVCMHKTLRVTPTMEAGIADHVWSLAEIVGLLDTADKKRVRVPGRGGNSVRPLR
jgi:hypothetical protein